MHDNIDIVCTKSISAHIAGSTRETLSLVVDHLSVHLCVI